MTAEDQPVDGSPSRVETVPQSLAKIPPEETCAPQETAAAEALEEEPADEAAAEGELAAAESGGAEAKPSAGLDAAILAALPEDAPAGHKCWELTRFCPNHKYPYSFFNYNTGAEKIRFQCTMLASGGEANALRLARACYVLLEKGASGDEAKLFRNEVYEKVKLVRERFSSDGSAPAKPAATAPTAAAPAAATERKEVQEAPSKDGVRDVKKEAAEALASGDVPASSPAHLKIRYDNSKGYHFFMIPGEQRRAFSISDKKYGTPLEECLRIGRVCYVQFEAGFTKDEVAKVRDDLLLQVYEEKGATKETPEVLKLKRKASIDMEAGDKAKEPKLELKRKASADFEEKGKEKNPKKEESKRPAVLGVLIAEDAPAESKAHQQVKPKLSTGACCFKFRRADGSQEHFQATIKASGGDLETCLRITRLCYVKFEQGALKAEVESYRNELYALVMSRLDSGVRFEGGEKAESKKEKKRKAEEEGKKEKKSKKEERKEDPIAAKLRAEGRLAGAMEVRGRDPTAKNSSINGLYAEVAGGYGSAKAYQKAGGTAPRYLLFSLRKKRWMINDELDDTKKGFAFAKTQDGAVPLPHDEVLRWQVFMGKEEGYAADPNVKCVPFETDGDKAKDKAASGDSEDSGDSDSSSSSSGSDAEDGDSDAKAPAAPVAAKGKAARVPRRSPLSPKGPPGTRNPKARVCAKMMVNSGLRDPRTFAHRREFV